MDVIRVEQVDQDAYIAVRDPDGDFLVDGELCAIYNAMPGEPGPRWRQSFLRGEVAYTRWDLRVLEDPDGTRRFSDSSGGRDTRALSALEAEIA
jgi:hypothetical protein